MQELLDSYDQAQDLAGKTTIIRALIEEEKKISNDSLSFDILIKAADFYLENISYDSAIFFLEQSEKRLNEESQTASFVRVWQLYGDCFFYKSNLVKAQEYYQKIIDLPPESDFVKDQILETFLDLSNMYSKFGYDSAARRSLQDAIAQNTLSEEHIKSRKIFHSLGLIYLNQNTFDSAIVYFGKAVIGLDSIEYLHRYGIYYNNVGICLQKQGKLLEADESYKQALVIRRAQEHKTRIASTLTNIATNALLLQSPERALEYAIECIELSKEVGNPDLLRKGYSLSKGAHMELGMFEEALKLQDLEIDLKDSVFDANQHKQMAQLEAKYEFQNKEAEIRTKNLQIEKSNIIRIFLIVGLVLLLLITLLIIRSNKLLKEKSHEIAEKNKLIEEKEALKSRWFVNISHELKTPLTLVKGPIEKVLNEENVNESGRQDLELARRNVGQLSCIVSEILDISKIEKGKLELKLEPIDLAHLVRLSVTAFESQAQSKRVKLLVNTPAQLMARVDGGNIQKVVTNLVANALKFTHAEGSISVKLEVKDEILLTIQDTGEGIPEADQDKVFERFFQSTTDNNKRRGGTGVGLSLSKEIVELHGGSITVESEIQEGSTFSVRLPPEVIIGELTNETLSTVEEEEILTEISFKSKIKEKPTVLLVEDNEDMRLFIKNILWQEAEVMEAIDGVEGIEMLEKTVPDLIISDVMMPRMDGITFAKEVKSTERWSKIPFIALTALDQSEDKLFTLRIGIDDYITKPFNAEELKVRVMNLLVNRQEMEAEPEELSYDDQILTQLEREVKENITEHFLSVTFLADQTAMSERKLQRYLKSQTGLTPNQFIREIKLRRAMESLEKKEYPTVAEVAHSVGFDTVKYFSELFVNRFGKKPSSYI